MNTYKISGYGWSAEIAPELGAKIIRLTDNEKDVIVPDKEMSNTLDSGISILFPAEVTKIDGYLLNKDGVEYSLPINDEEKSCCVNGKLYKSRFEIINLEEDKIELYFENHGEVYPFNFKLNVRYEMVEGGIKLHYVFRNAAKKYLPILFGINACFKKQDAFSAPIKERQCISEDKVPNGLYEALDIDEQKIMNGISFDEYIGKGFYSLNGNTSVIGKYKYTVSDNFNHLVIEKNGDTLKIKPISGAVNGLNFENGYEEIAGSQGEIFTAFIKSANISFNTESDNSKGDEWLLKQKNAVSKRDYSLLKGAYEILRYNTIKKETYPWGNIPVITPWVMRDSGIWGWDSAFHAITASRFDIDLAKSCVKAYLLYQQENGMFSDAVLSRGLFITTFTKPPVLAWAAVHVYKTDKDIDFLKWCYERLVKNEEWWYNEHRNGEFFRYSFGAESGWDNSPRWDKECPTLWAIDLQCFMITTYRALAFMAEELGDSSKVLLWRAREKWLTDAVEERFFDEENGTYADLSVSGEFSKVMTPASFMPLFIGIASEDHAKAMEKIGKEKFYPGMPTVAYDDPEYAPPGYWRGTTWLNVAYMATKGLKNYGFDELADGIKEYLLSMIYDNLENGIFENYDSLKRKGLHFARFGWSAAFTIEFILNWNASSDCIF